MSEQLPQTPVLVRDLLRRELDLFGCFDTLASNDLQPLLQLPNILPLPCSIVAFVLPQLCGAP
jgi:hypothetical protein